jgi:hypothetical protein
MHLIKKTTTEHFDKYESMYKAMKAAGVDLEAQAVSLIPVKNPLELLETMYKEDNILNNIPLRKFDAIFPRNHGVGGCMSLASNVCVLKHTMIFKLLKAKFVSED